MINHIYPFAWLRIGARMISDLISKPL